MNHHKERSISRWSISDTAKMALVTGLYVTITIALSVLSFGAIQIRLSEMFNYLSLYHKRYIVAVTLGVAMANIFSPLGVLDMIIGTSCTFIVLIINYYVTQHIKNMKVKYIITALLFSFSMFTIAIQLNVLYQTPFLFNWLIIGLGELASMTVGGVIIFWMSKKIDLTK